MMDKILKKAAEGYPLDDKEIIRLFQINDPKNFALLMETAFSIMKEHRGVIKLTSTVHITNICQVRPRCSYCGFAAGTSRNGYYTSFFKTDDEILEAARIIEKSGIPRVSCSGAHGFNGEHAVKAAEIVKENTTLELLINVGSDLNRASVEKLADYGTDTVCCNLETVNRELFRRVKPGEKIEDRIRVCELVCESGIELSSGLLIGLGESYADRLAHLRFLGDFETLGEIPIMGFNPYPGTPMENHPPCPLEEQMKTIAITRIMYPDIRITVPTPTIGPENVRFSLMAGADNLATVIPDGYPHDVKGVGSPRYGNLNDVLRVVDEMGLKPQLSAKPAADGVALL
ncbi:5,10-methenyltetrahydromethanopterin hydrogenase cofactor biosynthesis protein HmdB [Methanothermobacter sp.]|uniref:5,10-methenyltetrahydromethanopterin hydrogenase cofactor biosynthesis protein HmdB n=1 Tax=Methanothermobacter sp. TaxID=1884223 RepID=UPI002604FADB|nr:5,10-methenyltetrahydromethanopterin hydrogenase cofactor biosynthesis protein HmdB [Methanothermobacter sp.]MDI9618457.1 5,10-methenyltetrahydromethanopterin hydrogenase cofactor biosynthesis protein HmdB [Methanothermobacter sp.]